MPEGPTTVAVFNSNDDVVEMLRIALEMEGFIVVSAHVDEIRRGRVAIVDLIQQHSPDVIIYDVVPPYEHSWRFLEHLRADPSMEGREWVITSTNPQRAGEPDNASDTDRVLEIIGKPYDIREIVRAVKAAAARREGKTEAPAQPSRPM